MTASRETRGKAKQEELAQEHEHESKKQKVETRGRGGKGGRKQEKVHDGVEMDVDEKPGDGAAVEDVVERFEEFVDELKEHCSLEDLKAIAEENAITPDLPPRMLLLGL
jgi:hypothetical protein